MNKALKIAAAGMLSLLAAVGFAKPGNTKSNDKPTSTSSTKSKGKKSEQSKVLNNATCPVSGQPVGSMGPGVPVTYKGYTLNLCCAGCRDQFNQNPEAFLQKALGSKRQ